MRLIRSYFRAFLRGTTYDPRGNPYLWFGLLWGLLFPLLSIAMDLLSGAPGRRVPQLLREHPFQAVQLLQPLLLAVLFGAMGTLRHDLERELRELAMTDALTGLANRRRVLDELDHALARNRRTGEPFSLVMFDLDGFKRVNDERGHPEGDRVLKRTAAALRDVVRKGDVLGRYGGDEFLLVTHGRLESTDPLLCRAAEAVREASGLSISAGIARFPEDGDAAFRLIAAADRRLYELKRARPAGRRVSA